MSDYRSREEKMAGSERILNAREERRRAEFALRAMRERKAAAKLRRRVAKLQVELNRLTDKANRMRAKRHAVQAKVQELTESTPRREDVGAGARSRSEPTEPLDPVEYRDQRRTLREERKGLQQRDRRSKYEARASVYQEKEARLRAKMAGIRLRIERLQARAEKHETRHLEMLERSRELLPPLTAKAKQMVAGAVQQTRGALEEVGGKVKVPLQRVGVVTSEKASQTVQATREKTGQLGEAIRGGGTRTGEALAETPEGKETYTTHEKSEMTESKSPPLPKSGDKGEEKVSERVSSPSSQEMPRKGEEPKVGELETQSDRS